MITKQQIKYIRSLQQKKYRDQHHAFVVEGEKIVAEVLQYAAQDILMLVSTQNVLSENIKSLAIREKIDLIIASPDDFNRISSMKSPQGVLAVMDKQAAGKVESSENGNLILALDDLQDPGNLGTIMRLAVWFGVKQIICSPNTADVFNPKTVQASMGAIFHIAITHSELDLALSDLKKDGYTIYGTALEGDSLYEQILASPMCIILGNEGNGISVPVLHACDSVLAIPSFSQGAPNPESLNVSVAAGIVCSEIRRRGITQN